MSGNNISGGHQPVIDLVQRVASSVRDRHLLKAGQSVLVAVSGGVDSMVLLKV